MWDLTGPRLEPMSPALAGGFLTTAPPGKSRWLYLSNSEKPEFLLRLLNFGRLETNQNKVASAPRINYIIKDDFSSMFGFFNNLKIISDT